MNLPLFGALIAVSAIQFGATLWSMIYGVRHLRPRQPQWPYINMGILSLFILAITANFALETTLVTLVAVLQAFMIACVGIALGNMAKSPNRFLLHLLLVVLTSGIVMHTLLITLR